MNLSILKTLGIVDCAILLRTSDQQFKLEDCAAEWIFQLLPNKSKHTPISIEDSSIFLSDFLIDATEFWTTHHSGSIRSGIWTEHFKECILYLEAIAACAEGKEYLVIKNVEQAYHERKHTLQIARELSISNDEVIERHDYLSERLRSILLDNAQTDGRLPLQEAIRYASIGVIITDAQLYVQDSNPAAFDIFEHSQSREINKDHDELFRIIKDLIERQYPEKNIFKSNKHWSGEILWHTPPLASKWLQVNINAVSDQNNNVSHWIVSFSDQTRIKHLLQTNETLALHDPLTGLPNRQYFWQTLQQLISQEVPFYLLSIDIVNFKYANELFGYLAGDYLLKQVATRLSKELSANDFITRTGADEFMIIRKLNEQELEHSHSYFAEASLSFASKLHQACEQAFFTQDNRRCELPIKIGLTEYPRDANKAETLLNCAELALSFAKVSPEPATSIQMYNESLWEASKRRLHLEEAMKEAIQNQQFELLLQPIYDLASHNIIKAEALLRWHFEGETIQPDEFIPIAESSDCINLIGRWVISRACEMIKSLNRNSIHVPICVNFSPKQISDINFIDFIKGNTEAMDIEPRLLELEVTESVLLNNSQKVTDFFKQLREQGISISVDDFGTGYSSLAYLKHLPINTLKIDRSFIRDIETDEDDGAIVSAIIALAQKLNLGVVAEGIETKGQQDFLLSNHCNNGQGFLYSKPINLQTFQKLFTSKSDNP